MTCLCSAENLNTCMRQGKQTDLDWHQTDTLHTVGNRLYCNIFGCHFVNSRLAFSLTYQHGSY